MRAGGGWEDLTNIHLEVEAKKRDVDADEGDLSIDNRYVISSIVASGINVGVVEADNVTDGGDDEPATKHPDGTPDEERTTAESLEIGGLEKRVRVVKDEVDGGSIVRQKVALSPPEAISEAVDV